MLQSTLPTLLVGLIIAVAAPVAAQQTDDDTDALAVEIEQLVAGLIADRQQDRDAARDRILELAGPTLADADRVLALLPEPNERMPFALRAQLESLRLEIEERVAKSAVEPSLLTLDVEDAPLSDVLEQIEAQTGNQLLDYRQQFGQQSDARRVTVEAAGEPFWNVVDRVLDQAELDLYAYSGEEALALVNASPGAAPRAGAAAYAGPFRIAPTQVTASRNLRQPAQKALNLTLQIQWEPRLRPIAVSQPMSEIVAVNENGTRLSLSQPERSVDVELQSGNQSTEIMLPFVLPERETERIESLRGTMEVLAPGRSAEFRFEDIAADDPPETRKKGGVSVTLSEVRKNGVIWEVHMRLKLDQPGDSLASHRAWVFENKTHLEDDEGAVIDHAGFETTMQTSDEIGLAYLFDREEGIEGLTWVYHTPATILTFPVEYELKDIELP